MQYSVWMQTLWLSRSRPPAVPCHPVTVQLSHVSHYTCVTFTSQQPHVCKFWNLNHIHGPHSSCPHREVGFRAWIKVMSWEKRLISSEKGAVGLKADGAPNVRKHAELWVPEIPSPTDVPKQTCVSEARVLRELLIAGSCGNKDRRHLYPGLGISGGRWTRL